MEKEMLEEMQKINANLEKMIALLEKAAEKKEFKPKFGDKPRFGDSKPGFGGRRGGGFGSDRGPRSGGFGGRGGKRDDWKSSPKRDADGKPRIIFDGRKKFD